MVAEVTHERDVERLVENVWGFDGRAEPLGGWQDRNFRLRTVDGRTMVLKISHPDVSRETVECQISMLQYLGMGELAERVPRVVPTLDGRPYHLADDWPGAPRCVRILTYLPGRAIVDADDRPAVLLDRIGSTLATLDLELAVFRHPALRQTHEWDLMAVGSLLPLAQHIADADRRRRIETAVDGFSARVLPHRDRLEHGVIHGDPNDHNLMVSTGDGEPRLAGIIDFGDALLSPVVADLGICLAYLMLDRPDPFADAEHLIRGYNGVRPLSAVERELLPELVTGRVCASLLHAAHGRSRDPENSYLQISEEPMARLFDLVTGTGGDRFPAVVEAACG